MKNNRKGIILSGGNGTRLYPITLTVSKQLLPIYDKPMIYYPLCVLMQAGIREIAIIVAPECRDQYEALLGNGNKWGIKLTFIEQPKPEGLAQAYLLSEEFLDGSSSAMILGDNIFYGNLFSQDLIDADINEGATIFGYKVADPSRYGVIEYNKNRIPIKIIEKPENPPSNIAVTGLYFLDDTASSRAKYIRKSSRGEYEITSLLESYLEDKILSVKEISEELTWLDTGTHESLLEAGEFVRTVQKRHGTQVGCPEEIAFKNGWIDKSRLLDQINILEKNSYGKYLKKLLEAL
jgi:glucose-1-phosphate thymidylyltransferase